jgi:hypothetical protein
MELGPQQLDDLPIRPLLLLQEEEPQGENTRGMQAQVTPRDPILLSKRRPICSLQPARQV